MSQLDKAKPSVSNTDSSALILQTKTTGMKPRTQFCWITLLFAICTGQAQDLRLENRMVIDGIVLFENMSKPGQFYYVPDRGAIATDKKGWYQISFDKYVSEERDGPAGAIIQVLLDFSLPETKLLELENKLRLKKPGAGIVGAVPISSLPEEQFFIPVPEERNVLSFQFFPPASALVTIDVSKNNAQMLQARMQAIGFYLPLTCTYEVQYDGYAEIQADTLKMLFQADSDSAKSAITGRWLRQKTLRFFSDKGEEITLLDREIAPVTTCFTGQLNSLRASLFLPANVGEYLSDETITYSANRVFKIKAGSKLLFPLSYFLNTDEGKEEFKKSASNLNAPGFNTRRVNVVTDIELLESLDIVESYTIKVQILAGTLAQRSVYVIDNLLENVKLDGGRRLIEYPQFRLNPNQVKPYWTYGYIINQSIILNKFNAITNKSEAAVSDWEGLVVKLPQLVGRNIEVEYDIEKMQEMGIQGARIEFFEMKPKEFPERDAPINKDSISTPKKVNEEFKRPKSETVPIDSILNKFKEVLGVIAADTSKSTETDTSRYEIGQYLSYLVTDMSQPLIQKTLFMSRQNNMGFFYKITWILDSASASIHGSKGVIESKPESIFNSDYIYLTLPDLEH